MSFHSSAVLAADCSAPNSLASDTSATSNGTATASKSSRRGSKTGSLTKPRSLAMSVSSCSPVQPPNTEALRTWLAQAFPASHSASRGSKPQPTIRETCGPQRPMSFAQYDPVTRSLRMSQASLLPDIAKPSSETWPRWGLMRDGACSVLPTKARHTSERGCSLLPTPRKNSAMMAAITESQIAPHRFPNLETVIGRAFLPTICATDAKPVTGGNLYKTKSGSVRARNSDGTTSNRGITATLTFSLPTIGKNEYKGTSAKPFRGSSHYRGAKASEALRSCESDPAYLSPLFAEWMMGWPLTWAALGPLETAKFQQWLSAHGRS